MSSGGRPQTPGETPDERAPQGRSLFEELFTAIVKDDCLIFSYDARLRHAVTVMATYSASSALC